MEYKSGAEEIKVKVCLSLSPNGCGYLPSFPVSCVLTAVPVKNAAFFLHIPQRESPHYH